MIIILKSTLDADYRDKLYLESEKILQDIVVYYTVKTQKM